jgi:hypothetical protein
MARQKQRDPVTIHQPAVEMIPLNLLELNPANPKKPMSKDRLKGLNRSLTEFGLRDVVKIAPHPEIEGSYLILDGNTRIEELRKRTDENVKIPCLVHADLTSREKITEFVLTFDRNVKAYDEMAVIGQLKELVDSGEDLNMLAELVNLPDLQQYIDNIQPFGDGDPLNGFDPDSLLEQDSIVVSGHTADIDGIRATLKNIKGKMNQSERIGKLLRHVEGFDWDNDDSLLFVVLAIAAHLSNNANKLLIPCASFDQKKAILARLAETIERENLEGPFALGTALGMRCEDGQSRT